MRKWIAGWVGMAVIFIFAHGNVCLAQPTPRIIAIPGGEGGVGLDDISYSPFLKRVILPGAGTGDIYLLNPASNKLEVISGFTKSTSFHGGFEGVTSADAGDGFIFAVDHGSQQLDVIDAQSHNVVGSTKLAGAPDFVRYVSSMHEIWVTEPHVDRIETFTLSAGKTNPAHHDFLAVFEGPESLLIDNASGRAFTNSRTGTSYVFDLKSGDELKRFKNGCRASRGLGFDAAHDLLFVGCKEGKLEVLDAKSARLISETTTGAGVDIIAYDPTLAHAYLPAARSATMATIAVSSDGRAKLLGTVDTVHGAHCAAVDQEGGVYVCDPLHGKILVFRDSFH
jgi:DNA-binding beta-propeller fold protein YncE